MVIPGVYAYLKCSALRHRAHGVVAQIPENLLHTIRVNHGWRATDAKISDDCDLSGPWIIFEQRKRFINCLQQVMLGEIVVLLPQVLKKIRDDIVQALRFARDDTKQSFVIVTEIRDT